MGFYVFSIYKTW